MIRTDLNSPADSEKILPVDLLRSRRLAHRRKQQQVSPPETTAHALLERLSDSGDPSLAAQFFRRWQFERAIEGDSSHYLPAGQLSALIYTLRGLLEKTPGAGGVTVAPYLEDFPQDHDFARYSVLKTPLPLITVADPEAVRQRLKEQAPNFKVFIDKMFDFIQMSWRIGDGRFRLPPLLLVGPSGSGKSWIAQRLAEELGVAFMTVNAGGASDSRFMVGTARGWGTAQPSAPARLLQRARIANPIMIVEEIDKAGGSSRNGRIQETLLALLEPATSRNWMDECLCTGLDLSHMCWIFTANDASNLPSALLSRVQLIDVSAPLPAHLRKIIRGMADDIVRSYGGAPLDALLSEEDVEALCRGFTAEGGDLRAVQRRVLDLLAKHRPMMN